MSKFVELQICVEPKIIDSETLRAELYFKKPDAFAVTIAIATDKLLSRKKLADAIEDALQEIPINYLKKISK